MDVGGLLALLQVSLEEEEKVGGDWIAIKGDLCLCESGHVWIYRYLNNKC